MTPQASSDLAVALASPARLSQALKAQVFRDLTALRQLGERMAGTLHDLEALGPRSPDGRRLAISLAEAGQAIDGAARMIWSDFRECR